LYTNPTVANAPSAPSATITWSTSAISSITSGWSQTPPTISATSTNSVYSSQLIFIDATAPFTTTTVTGTSPIESINFTGVVTFNSGDFLIGGSTITTIDGDNLTTGTVNAEKIDVDSAITLTGATSSFIAGRTGASDFGTDGFFIGRTSTSGNAADGFQLSHTSVTDANHLQLNSGTIQGVIHDDTQGLRIYEPVFYSRGTVTGADSLLDAAAETATLAAGEIHSVTIWGGGGGGGAGSDSGGTAGNAGGTGGTSTVTLTGATGFNGTRTFNATGGIGGAGGSGISSGASGGAGGGSAFGSGGLGGVFRLANDSGNQDTNYTGLPGSAPATSIFAAGGGGGAPGSHNRNSGSPGLGGSSATPVTVTYDLTNANTAGILTLNALGAAGASGNNNNNFSGDNNPGGIGGTGRAGVASVSGVLDGYTASTLSDLSPPKTPYFTDGNLTAWSTNNSGDISGGTNGVWAMCTATGNGYNNNAAQLNGVAFTPNGAGSWIQGVTTLSNSSSNFGFGATGETFSIGGGSNARAGVGVVYAWIAPNGTLTRAALANGMGVITKTRYRAV
jgi:hypothetical protein